MGQKRRREAKVRDRLRVAAAEERNAAKLRAKEVMMYDFAQTIYKMIIVILPKVKRIQMQCMNE